MATTFLLPRNNIKTTLSTAINSSTTSIEVVNGSIFPNSFSGRKVLITVCDDPDPALSANFEFMLVTARTGNTLTVERGAYGTSPLAFEALDAVRVFITKEYFDEVHTSINAIEAKTDFITVTQNVNLDTIESDVLSAKTKTDWLTVTQAVNLDTVESDINLVKQAYIVEGQLRNGKISVTLSGSNLVVAVKTLANADPSVNDPVKIMIDGVDRSITSALSVTATAGTNWFNAGSTELATRTINYFIYIGYNSTDGVTLGFSPIPWARIYSNFSTSSTSMRHCRISTTTNASATDTYIVVGNFDAILSGTNNWTACSNLILSNLRNSKKIIWAPTLSWTAGTAPSGSGTNNIHRYWWIERTLFFSGQAYSFTPGSTVTTLTINNLPHNAESTASDISIINGRIGSGVNTNFTQGSINYESNNIVLRCNSVSADNFWYAGYIIF